MSYPTFTKDSDTLVFPRTDLYPRSSPVRANQLKSVSQGQVVRVATLAPPTQLLPVHFELLPYSTFTGLRNWLINVVNFSAETFTYTDTEGTGYTVRWWPEGDYGIFDMPLVAQALYNVDLPLRVE